MNLRQLAAELRSVREDLKAVRKALEEKHCPASCSCRPAPVQWYPNLTTSAAVLPTITWVYNTTTGTNNLS
jgi:hypothetical protein